VRLSIRKTDNNVVCAVFDPEIMSDKVNWAMSLIINIKFKKKLPRQKMTDTS
jgi:hypothetical protein